MKNKSDNELKDKSDQQSGKTSNQEFEANNDQNEYQAKYKNLKPVLNETLKTIKKKKENKDRNVY